MPLQAQLSALTVPTDTEFPPTVQELLDLIAQYEEITGLEDFNGINYGSTEPSAENRDRPWFKLDDDGDPVGWFSWTGAEWVPIPQLLPRGITADRPINAVAGQLYEDTTIDVVLRYTGSEWVTLAGSPGDVKEVKAATVAEALSLNPGWSWDEDSVGMVIGGASDGTSSGEHAYNTEEGAEEITLAVANLPADTISLLTGWGIFPGQFQNGSQSAGVFPITTGLGSTSNTGPINGGVTQTAVSVLQPTRYYWRLVKD